MTDAHPPAMMLDGTESGTHVFDVSSDTAMRASVHPDEAFVLRALDASSNRIRPNMTSEYVEGQPLFPVTGPVHVEWARAGDAVGISVVSIRVAPTGHVWTRPGLGLLDSSDLHVRPVSTGTLELEVGRCGSLSIPPRLHIGTLGVCPQEATAARDLGGHGGNLDAAQVGEGATLWVRARIDGAGVFAGDVHAAMGDGEVCGTGVEVAAEVGLEVTADNRWAPLLPTVETADGRIWLIGYGETLDEALSLAVRTVVDAVSERAEISWQEAYEVTSLLLTIQVCQIVNPHTTVAVSLASGLDKLLVPAIGTVDSEPLSGSR